MKLKMRRLGFVPVALLALPLLGCPPEVTDDDDEDQGNSTPMTVMEICAMYLSFDSNSNLCTQAKVGSGLDIDAATLERDCRPGTDARGWSEDLLAAQAAGRVNIDWVQAHKCVDTSRELRAANPGHVVASSAEWSANRDGPCQSFYSGAVADGGDCQDDWDCGDGSFCYSDNPFTAGSTKCMKPAGDGQACGDYHGCAEGFTCEGNACVALAANGQPCEYPEDCQSGYCESSSGSCAPAPGPIAMGQPCTADDACDHECGHCRPDSAGGSLVCNVLGAAGTYCRDWWDCLWDLGCTNNQCGTVGADQACALSDSSPIQSLCDPGMYCVPSVRCSDFSGDQATCDANAPTCAFDANYGECSYAEGTCVADLPTSGACLYNAWCGPDTYCRPSDNTCVALAGLNETCSDDGTTGAPCGGSLTCVEGSCKQLCEYNEDCGSGQFCNGEGNCEAFHTSDCEDSMQCPDEQYCAIPEDTCVDLDETACGTAAECAWSVSGSCSFASDCWDSAIVDQPGCEALPGCVWDGSACDVACYAFDNDETGCSGAGGCMYDVDLGYCDPICFSLTDEPSCGGETSCTWETTAVCELTAGLVGSCQPQLAVGESCTDSEQCLSGDCNAIDETQTEMQCATELSGCNRDGSYIRSVFLFGGVLFLARGLARRRRR